MEKATHVQLCISRRHQPPELPTGRRESRDENPLRSELSQQTLAHLSGPHSGCPDICGRKCAKLQRQSDAASTELNVIRLHVKSKEGGINYNLYRPIRCTWVPEGEPANRLRGREPVSNSSRSVPPPMGKWPSEGDRHWWPWASMSHWLSVHSTDIKILQKLLKFSPQARALKDNQIKAKFHPNISTTELTNLCAMEEMGCFGNKWPLSGKEQWEIPVTADQKDTASPTNGPEVCLQNEACWGMDESLPCSGFLGQVCMMEL
ncbi:hypothetical protein EYF80_001092 [Liparis tanakae]|uniref:Uncharacterized protein n=1 Tax=Liparis tanakae TaxID=230148 RepID=A0A4Z2JF07_9TELE|nr:hypothetical protein EYF80_001092 [Liparis tanakae]